MKIIVIGADGQLGCDLAKVIPAVELIPLTIKDINITVRDQTLDVIRRVAPDVVINTAAYNQVDRCELEPLTAFSLNTVGVQNVAIACEETDSLLVQLSTDYVFDGEKGSPYGESDRPRPLSIYGISKLGGEYCAGYLSAKHLVVRTSGLYGAAGCLGKGGGNFVENMIQRAEIQTELRVVSDEILSPTYALDLAKILYDLIREKATGLYHVTNAGYCSWFDLTAEIFRLLGKKAVVNPITAKTFHSPARRPKFSALTSEKLKLPPRPWQAALRAYLIEKGHLKSGEGGMA